MSDEQEIKEAEEQAEGEVNAPEAPAEEAKPSEGGEGDPEAKLPEEGNV